MNGDGFLDFVIAVNDVTNFIVYYENQNTPGFTFESDMISNFSTKPSTNVRIADFDNNGTLDIIWSGRKNDNSGAGGWFSNDGSGEFTDEGYLLNGQGTLRLLPLHLNNDDLIDLISVSVFNGRNGIVLNENGSDIEFILFKNIYKVTHPISISAFQDDADANEELLTINRFAKSALKFDEILSSESNVDLIFFQDYNFPKKGNGFDLDSDGDADLLFLFNQGLVIFRNNESSYQDEYLPFSGSIDAYKVFDINEDGVMDIVGFDREGNSLYAWYSNGTSYSGRVLIANDILGTSDFTYTTQAGGAISKGFVYQKTNRNIINLPKGEGVQFSSPNVIKEPLVKFISIFVEDTNGDGLPDILGHASTAILQFLNDGSATLGELTPIHFQSDIAELFLEDFSKDGLADILIHTTGESGSVSFFLNDGEGVFSFEQGTTVPYISKMALVDIDGDSDKDIVFGKTIYLDRRLTIVFNNFNPPSSEIAGAGSNQGGLGMYVYPNPTANSFRLSNPEMLEGGECKHSYTRCTREVSVPKIQQFEVR